MPITESTIQLGGTAAEYPLEFEQGASWSKTLYLQKTTGFPKDLTGYTAKAQIRSKVESEEVIAEITTRFVLPRKYGQLVLSLTAEETLAFTFYTAVWDLFITSPEGIKSKLLKGSVLNHLTVTRDEPVTP